MLLFKMFEAHKHLNNRIDGLGKQEKSLGKVIEGFQDAPAYFSQYEKVIPEAIAGLAGILETIDF